MKDNSSKVNVFQTNPQKNANNKKNGINKARNGENGDMRLDKNGDKYEKWNN